MRASCRRCTWTSRCVTTRCYRPSAARTCGETKTHGLIVDYLGIFDDVALAIQFGEEGITPVVTNINGLVAALPAAVQKCLEWFSGIDRTVTGYEGLIAAQECLPDNEARNRFAADYSHLARLWDAISPDPSMEPYEADHGWLGQVYESVKPSTGTGKLLWHTLGAKTSTSSTGTSTSLLSATMWRRWYSTSKAPRFSRARRAAARRAAAEA